MIGILYYYARNLKWQIRYPVMILAGWMIFIVSVILLNDFAFHYAPTKELMEAAANGDGAANAFAIVFGWVYALVVLLVFEVGRKVVVYLRSLF
jgi:uncharacterized membrane protein